MHCIAMDWVKIWKSCRWGGIPQFWNTTDKFQFWIFPLSEGRNIQLFCKVIGICTICALHTACSAQSSSSSVSGTARLDWALEEGKQRWEANIPLSKNLSKNLKWGWWWWWWHRTMRMISLMMLMRIVTLFQTYLTMVTDINNDDNVDCNEISTKSSNKIFPKTAVVQREWTWRVQHIRYCLLNITAE